MLFTTPSKMDPSVVVFPLKPPSDTLTSTVPSLSQPSRESSTPALK